MKTPIALLLTAAMLAPTAPAMAQPGGHDRPGDHRGYDNHGPQGRGPGAHFVQFRKGDRFDRRRAPNYAMVDYRRYHRLSPPPRGYHWVRSGNDAVLVGIASGIVASVIVGAIR